MQGDDGMTIEPEEDAPLLLNQTAFQRIYQEVEEPDDEGNIEILKLQATKEFKDRFNGLVFSLLSRAIHNARLDDRKTLWPEDVPDVEEV